MTLQYVCIDLYTDSSAVAVDFFLYILNYIFYTELNFITHGNEITEGNLNLAGLFIVDNFQIARDQKGPAQIIRHQNYQYQGFQLVGILQQQTCKVQTKYKPEQDKFDEYKCTYSLHFFCFSWLQH
ncbi:hypothetical protein ACJX0J_020533 [Zea mays]